MTRDPSQRQEKKGRTLIPPSWLEQWRQLSLEDRLFVVTSGVGELLALLTAAENLAVNGFVLLTCVAAAGLYLFFLGFYAWKKIALRASVCVLSTLFLVVMWLFNDGFEGGAQYFIIFTFIGALLLLRKLPLLLVLSFDTVVVAGLFVVEFLYPDVTMKYIDRPSRYLDIAISFFTAVAVLLVALRVINQMITRVRMEAEQKNDELRNVRDRLETLGLMAAQVGHELNTPNHVISLNARLLESLHKRIREDRIRAQEDGLVEVAGDSEFAEAVPLVRSILKASAQINQILVDLRFEVRPQNSPVPLDLASVVRQTAQLYQVRWREETSRLIVKTPETPLLILGVEFRLQQLLVNLVTNALSALATKDKAVCLTVEAQEMGPVLTVSDEGEGMSPEVQAKLGTSFFTTKGAKDGTGFGWRLCQEIVNEHGAHLELESQLGAGTLVTVRFPGV